MPSFLVGYPKILPFKVEPNQIKNFWLKSKQLKYFDRNSKGDVLSQNNQSSVENICLKFPLLGSFLAIKFEETPKQKVIDMSK